MKIECKLKRQGGSLVTLGGKEYHFTPDQLDRHVAEVTDEAHIERFLEIPQYREIKDDAPAKVEPTTSGDTLTPQDEDGDEGELDIEQARQAYFDAFGKKPHHAMHADTMYERIEKGEA